MDNKNDNLNSENKSFSDDVELFDDIFSEGTDTVVPDTKKERPRSPAPSGKAPTPKPDKKVEQRPGPPKVPPVNRAASPVPPIKKEPSVEPGKPMEKQSVSDSENNPFSDGVELFDDIFSDRMDADLSDNKREQPTSPGASAKAASPTTPTNKVEQRLEPPKVPPDKKAAPPAPPIKKGPPVEPGKPMEKQPVSTPPVKAASPTTPDKKVEQRLEPPKVPPDKKAASPAPPIKKGPPVGPGKPMEKQPVSTPPVKAASPTTPDKKVEQRLEPPKVPPVKKAAPPAPPIKKGPLVEPGKPIEKQPVSYSENDPFSDGVELFDDIFDEGTDAYLPETKKEQRPSPAPRAKAPISELVKKVEQRPEPQKLPSIQKAPPPPIISEPCVEVDTYLEKRSGKYEESKKQEIEKLEFHEKPKKNVNPFIFISSIVVLVILSMLTGRVINYEGIIEYVKTTTHLKSDKKAPVKIDEIKDGKTSGVISDLKTSSLVTKDVKSKMQDSNIQVPQTLKEDNPPVISNGQSEKVVPVRDTDEVISSEDHSKEDLSPVSTTPPISEKATNEDTDVSNRGVLSYPYSIYLGSYNTVEGVKEATSNYEEMGLSPYWIKMDLGEKGIWFRLYANYFQTREEVDRFIKTKQIPGAELKKTNYVNLISIYSSEQEVNKQKEIIEKLGYCPYVIKDNKNIFRLYVGAFYQKDMAEEQNADLLLKGIQSKVVER